MVEDSALALAQQHYVLQTYYQFIIWMNRGNTEFHESRIDEFAFPADGEALSTQLSDFIQAVQPATLQLSHDPVFAAVDLELEQHRDYLIRIVQQVYGRRNGIMPDLAALHHQLTNVVLLFRRPST